MSLLHRTFRNSEIEVFYTETGLFWPGFAYYWSKVGQIQRHGPYKSLTESLMAYEAYKAALKVPVLQIVPIIAKLIQVDFKTKIRLTPL